MIEIIVKEDKEDIVASTNFLVALEIKLEQMGCKLLFAGDYPRPIGNEIDKPIKKNQEIMVTFQRNERGEEQCLKR